MLFHLKIVEVRFWTHGRKLLDVDDQLLWAMDSKEGWDNHMASSLNGFFFEEVTGLVSKRSGQWSKWVRGRWEIMLSGNRFSQDGFATNLSSLSIINWLYFLRLDHVYLGPLNPKSSILQQLRKLLNWFIRLWLGGLPPNFLEIEEISLNSPNTTQGPLKWLANNSKFHHRAFLKFL